MQQERLGRTYSHWLYRGIFGVLMVMLASMSSGLLLSFRTAYVPPLSGTVAAQVAGNGGTENVSVFYYRTVSGQVNPFGQPTCPTNWTQALDGYGPHYIATMNYDWVSGGTGGTGGGFARPDEPPTITTPPPPDLDCFTGETMVSMADGGYKQIQDVHVGDRVFSFTHTGELVVNTVLEVYRHPESQLRLNIIAGDTLIKTTEPHPFWVGGNDFVLARDLRVGDYIYRYDVSTKQFAREQIHSIAKIDTKETVYNLSVTGTHTYLANGFAVHNVKPGSPPPNGDCFTGETPVRMSDGSLRRIDEVRVGDSILAFTAAGVIDAAVVTETYRHPDVAIEATVTAGSFSVVTTPVHPFYVGNGKFKAVSDLRIGDWVYVYSKENNTLERVRISKLSFAYGSFEVFNLSVDGPHTFIAGDFAVHNKGGGGGGGGGNQGGGGGGSSGGAGGGAGGSSGGGGLLPVLEPSGGSVSNFWSVPQALAATSYRYVISSVGIGSDSVCSQDRLSVVKVVPFYLNATTTNQTTMYSDACSVDKYTGALECNRCLVCYK